MQKESRTTACSRIVHPGGFANGEAGRSEERMKRPIILGVLVAGCVFILGLGLFAAVFAGKDSPDGPVVPDPIHFVLWCALIVCSFPGVPVFTACYKLGCPEPLSYAFLFTLGPAFWGTLILLIARRRARRRMDSEPRPPCDVANRAAA